LALQIQRAQLGVQLGTRAIVARLASAARVDRLLGRLFFAGEREEARRTGTDAQQDNDPEHNGSPHGKPHDDLVQNKASPGRPLRAVENLAGELTTGGIDVVTARLAGRGHHAGISRISAKRRMRGAGERRYGDPGKGLKGIRLNLHGTLARQRQQLARLRIGVVDGVQHHVLESHKITRRLFQVALTGRPSVRAKGICG
jgi:hypothetical protein